MNFNKHFDKEGKHAILSASSWRWLNDDKDSLVKRISSQYAQTIGTILHSIAYKHIKFRIKMNKFDKKNVMLELLSNGIPGIVIDTVDFDSMYENLMNYVNDCVGFKMYPEVVLYYSDNFFGTTDAISYNENERFLNSSNNFLIVCRYDRDNKENQRTSNIEGGINYEEMDNRTGTIRSMRRSGGKAGPIPSTAT